jgi:hypothetical protein
MIYDFGLAEEYTQKRPSYYDHYDALFNTPVFEQDTDTNRLFIYDYYDYRNMLRTFWKEYCFSSLSPNGKIFMTELMRLTAPNRFASEDELIDNICQLFVTKCPSKNMFVENYEALPSGEKLVNMKPYFIDETLKLQIDLSLSQSSASSASSMSYVSLPSSSSRSKSSQSMLSISSLSSSSRSSTSMSS